MSKARVIVLSVVHQGLTKAEAARRYDVSWQWVHTLVTRYQAGGLDALEPRSRRPASNSRATPEALRERIVELRKQLDASGLDAGPVTIASHLSTEGHTAPSTDTPPPRPTKQPRKPPPTGTTGSEPFRLRLDHIDNGGKVSLRRAGRMHHLGIGYRHRGQPVLLLADPATITVVHRTTGEVLSEHDIDPPEPTGATKNKSPADGQTLNDDPTHLSTMTRLITMVEVVGRYSNFPQPLLCGQSIHTLSATIRPEPIQSPPPRVHALDRRLSAETLRQLLSDYQAGVSANQLAVRYQLSRSSVRRLLRESGVPRRYQAMTELEVDQSVDLYQSGLTISQVASKVDRPCSTVQMALARRGVDMRRRHDNR
jgi:transposase